MNRFLILRRGAMLGAVAAAAGCDVVDFATNPMPRFEQTWDLPAPGTSVSVASLLPPNTVQILPDSSAFALTVAGASTNSNALGSYCGACQTLNGTNAIKPAFAFTFENSRPLPADVVTAAVTSGSLVVQLSNGLSFDPVRVKTGPGAQGFVVIFLKTAGGQVLVQDTILKGATQAWPPGSTVSKTYPIATGVLRDFIAADMELNSPEGDHAVFMDANRRMSANVTVPTMNVGTVGVNVPSRAITSPSERLDLSGMGELGDRVVRGALVMTVTNPFAVSASVGMRFAYGTLPTQVITKTVAIQPSGTRTSTVSLDSAEMALLMGNVVNLSVAGTATSTGPVTVTPRQAIRIDNRMVLTIRTGGGN